MLKKCFETSVTKLKYGSNVSEVLDLYKCRTHMRENGTWMALLAIKPLTQGQQSLKLSTDSPLTRQRNLRNQLTSRHSTVNCRHEGQFSLFAIIIFWKQWKFLLTCSYEIHILYETMEKWIITFTPNGNHNKLEAYTKRQSAN